VRRKALFTLEAAIMGSFGNMRASRRLVAVENIQSVVYKGLAKTLGSWRSVQIAYWLPKARKGFGPGGKLLSAKHPAVGWTGLRPVCIRNTFDRQLLRPSSESSSCKSRPQALLLQVAIAAVGGSIEQRGK
jgi:hypothetical protein